MTEPFILKKDAILQDVALESPDAAELLQLYGLHCISCFASAFDTLEMGAKVHGMSDEDVTKMIEEINQELKERWEKEGKQN